MSGASADNALRVIVGPTAAGKSALGLELAVRFRGAIVSADSRQIYRGFDIGTGKPTAEERARVPYFGVDVAEPAERWSAARFASAAGGWLADASRDGRAPVVVGGTGFWISALVAPLTPMPELDEVRRAELAVTLDAMGQDDLRTWCASLDPAIARLGPVQWRRAVEVALLTGRRLSDWHADAPRSSRVAARYLVLDPGEALDNLIAARVDAMLGAGWVAEVESLMARVPAAAIAWKACGYERLRDAIVAREPLGAARDDIVRETRRYARRQRTWFRTQLRHGAVTRIDPRDAGALDRASAWWQGANGE